MSEYNVFIDESGITIFDWPQAVSVDHDNARELLERDLDNIYGYFRRKYPAETPESVDLDALAGDLVADDLDSVPSYAEP